MGWIEVYPNPRTGLFTSLSNRRLHQMRALAWFGLIDVCPVVIYSFDHSRVQHNRDGDPKWYRSQTTETDGRFVSFRDKVWNKDDECYEYVDAQGAFAIWLDNMPRRHCDACADEWTQAQARWH